MLVIVGSIILVIILSICSFFSFPGCKEHLKQLIVTQMFLVRISLANSPTGEFSLEKFQQFIRMSDISLKIPCTF